MPHLALTLFGAFEVTLASQAVTAFEYDKVQALLAYLAVEADHLHRRETLAGLLWPERPECRARQNLSQALFNLRHAIGDLAAEPPFLLVTPQTLQFNPASDYWLDVTAFTDLLTACQVHLHDRLETCEACMVRLRQAVELYRGNFLEGFSLSDSPAFEEWVVLTRERLHRLAGAALGHLAGFFESRGAYEEALTYAWRQMELEPWREDAQRQLIRLLALSGQRSTALAQYDACCRLLAKELGVEPEAETTALYEQIRAGKLSRGAEEWPLREVLFRGTEEIFPSALPLSHLPPFVAREGELAQLSGFLDMALTGQGRVVFVTGGPGQGKTALIQEFARQAQATHPHLMVVGGRGNAHTGVGDPYLPFREILGQLTGDREAMWAAGIITPEQTGRLENLLPRSIQVLGEVGPDLINTFLAREALLERVAALTAWPDRVAWLTRLRQQIERAALRRDPAPSPQSDLFEQYTRLLRLLAEQNPLVLLLDDLQWADLGSINLLFHLGRRLESSHILVIGAYRPAEVALGYDQEDQARHPLESVVNEFKRRFGAIDLDLGQADDRHFVDSLLDAEPNCLDERFRQTLYRQTGGHPLFTVELLHGMQERGDLFRDQAGCWVEGPTLDWETLPPRVEAVIAERLGRLPECLREALSVASVEGEIFTAEVVAQVRAASPVELVHALSEKVERIHRLVTAQGVRQRNGQHLSMYRFRHFLFQRYLYHQLDLAERVYLHEAVGLGLERLYGETVDEIALQLARHFQEAGLTGKAIDYLSRAGERAVRLSANEEALTHFNQALALLKTLPESPERARQEIDLQLALAVSYLVTRGYGAPEVERAYERAQELCQQVGEMAQLFRVWWVTHSFYGIQEEFQKARDIASQFLSLAQQTQDPLLTMQAHYMLGQTLFCVGELAPARAALEQVIAFYDPQQHHGLVSVYGHDIGVDTLSWSSWVLWLLGYPDQAEQRSREALALAEKLEHPLSLACALGFASMIVYNCRRSVSMIRDLAEKCLRISSEHRFPYWLAYGTICNGWVRVQQGQIETGLAEMRQGMADRRTMGVELTYSLFLAILAEEYGKMGQIEAGLSLIAEALEIIHQRQERFSEAEIYRLKGELLLKQGEAGAEAEAENCFFEAIKVARRQQAKSLELRATMSLARLWQRRGQQNRARPMLTEIYSWFSEGFDTTDLQEARALLVELG